ncbi:hypothetical protein OG579_03435 [Williamsia herbipolensis]|uniref:Immunity protein 63 domain-containing protein n=1 Tax=Williamsia herbipolensis TaxID=1603258 RepID=A0AAU4K462_9NOCA|nr:hypothetical protein [Williamsia herbipolensis]
MTNDDYESRIFTLVSSLIEKTNQRTISWALVDDDTFEYAFTRSAVQVKSEDRDGRWPFYFTILDEQARPIEQVYESANSTYFQLDKLYQCASRSHRGLDEKIAEMLEELQKTDDPWASKRKTFKDDEPPF